MSSILDLDIMEILDDNIDVVDSKGGIESDKQYIRHADKIKVSNDTLVDMRLYQNINLCEYEKLMVYKNPKYHVMKTKIKSNYEFHYHGSYNLEIIIVILGWNMKLKLKDFLLDTTILYVVNTENMCYFVRIIFNMYLISKYGVVKSK